MGYFVPVMIPAFAPDESGRQNTSADIFQSGNELIRCPFSSVKIQCMTFAHNHPSGLAEPSRADEALTVALKQALALVDVRVLDHFVVAGDGALSFAERGLM